METQLLKIAKLVMIMLVPFAITACGGGGGGSTPQPEPKIEITNPGLISLLKGSPDFGGIGSYIDTNAAFNAADIFLGLAVPADAKSIITENYNRYLQGAPPASFYSGTSPYSGGVAVNTGQNKISVTLPDITVSWVFSGSGVTRTYAKNSAGGTNNSSTTVYSYNSGNGLTTASFSESVDETSVSSGKPHTKKAAYAGTVAFERSATDSTLISLKNATFSQSHTETNSNYAMSGTVVMTGTGTAGTLAFENGTYSFDLPSYNTVSGTISMTGGSYGKGGNAGSGSYANNNTIENSTLKITSTKDYSNFTPVVNSVALGVWAGTFTDSCTPAKAGSLGMSITATTATWWGISSDSTRVYGDLIAIDGTVLNLKNSAASWGTSSSITASTVAGTWSSGSCSGTFSVN
ncbi:MAG: hypothetical protein ACOYL3_14265 [Desulfuromonadaceae bacterium]